MNAHTSQQRSPASIASSHRSIAWVIGLTLCLVGGWALADPPARVARLGYVSGSVSFSAAGEDDWVQARLNRPLVTGDRVWADADGRGELQLGSAVVRIAPSTNVNILNIDDRAVQLELTQGSLNVHLKRLAPSETFEVDTPNLALTVHKPGDFRIDVDPAGNATVAAVRNGEAEVYGENASYVLHARDTYRFAGTGLRDYQQVTAAQSDDFDRWCSERNRRFDASVSARYVSPYVVGYQDLDTYGTWRNAAGYGYVWQPSSVAAGWAPYRDGHWAWIDPWGWTWVDDAPWGFAPSHYGRWANLNGSWCWVPGPVAARPVYAPALVAFVGGGDFQIAVGGGNVAGVAWFPLGPREVYQPAYAASRRYFEDVNVTNARIDRASIGRVYANPSSANVAYVNRHVPGAVVALPATAFARGEAVGRAAVRVPRERIDTAAVTPTATVRPTRESVVGERKPSAKPPAALLERTVVARTQPPPKPAAFERREPMLARNPGHPLDSNALRELTQNASRNERVHVVRSAQPATAIVPAQHAKADARDKMPPPTAASTMQAAPPGNAAPSIMEKGKEHFAKPAPAPRQTAAEPPVSVAPGKMATPAAAPITPGQGGPRDRFARPDARSGKAAEMAAPKPEHQRAEPQARPPRQALPPTAAAMPAQPPAARHAQAHAAKTPDVAAAPPPRHAETRPMPAPQAAPAPRHAEAHPKPAPQAAPPQKHADARPMPAPAPAPAPAAAPPPHEGKHGGGGGGEPKPEGEKHKK